MSGLATVARYLRLYGHFVRFSFSRAFEFRFDFFFRIVMDLAYYGTNLFFYKLIFLQTPILAGWNQNQIFVFVTGFLVVDAITMTVFSNNLWLFPIAVNRGDLDYYLVRPISSLFFLTLRDFAANSFINLLLAFGLFGWALFHLHSPFSIGAVILYLILLFLGSVLHSIVHLLIVMPVFWLQSGSGLHAIFYSLTRFMERPDRIFAGWTRRILVTVLPFSIMASFPARIFLEGLDFGLLVHFGLVLVFFCCLTLVLWRYGLRSYASASS
jgi:ABC-2 type transport system permease protein